MEGIKKIALIAIAKLPRYIMQQAMYFPSVGFFASLGKSHHETHHETPKKWNKMEKCFDGYG